MASGWIAFTILSFFRANGQKKYNFTPLNYNLKVIYSPIAINCEQSEISMFYFTIVISCEQSEISRLVFIIQVLWRNINNETVLFILVFSDIF